MNGTCNGTIVLGPHLLGPWGGTKRSNIIKSQLQSQFQRFLNKNLRVFSQMKDIKHIRQDFHSVTYPRVWDLGLLEGQKLNFLNMVIWHIILKGMCSRRGYTVLLLP